MKLLTKQSCGDLSKIPSTEYAILGGNTFCKKLLDEIKIKKLNLPIFILDDEYENTFEDIPVKKIKQFKSGSLPVVLAADLANEQPLRKAFFKQISEYNQLIYLHDVDVSKDKKIFCIGIWKTGTTSIELAMKEMGYVLGRQLDAELLLLDWYHGKSSQIIQFCNTANAFQDSPFCCTDVYKILDKEFPKSKFILSVRNSPEQWFNSLCRFHTKKFSSDKSKIPTVDDLKESNSPYYDGFRYDSYRMFWGENWYKKEDFTQRYIKHNTEVIDYFANKPNQLLVLNVAEKNAYRKLSSFLEKKCVKEEFPWLNKA